VTVRWEIFFADGVSLFIESPPRTIAECFGLIPGCLCIQGHRAGVSTYDDLFIFPMASIRNIIRREQ
jgi:hypothetical protein